MEYAFFSVPVQSSSNQMEELNKFLASHKILSVEKQFVSQGENSLWCFSICYQSSRNTSGGFEKGVKSGVDYKDILNSVDFALYSRLRVLRKDLASKAGVPVYSIFTNEQLAELATKKPLEKSALQSIAGIGKQRQEKYAEPVFGLIKDFVSSTKITEDSHQVDNQSLLTESVK